MKKVILIVGILLFCSSATVAYAGSLNAYESEVVAAAQGVFESDGIKYKLDSSFVNQLINYLSSDDVDLTQDQKNEVLATMNDYIETGVQEGYLIPIEGQKLPETTTDNSGSSGTSEKSGENANSTETTSGKDATKTSENKTSDNQGTKEADTQANEGDNALIEEISEQISVPEVEATPEITQVPIDLAEDNLIIKNTGFNFNRTVLVAVGMGMLMMLGMMVTYKHNFFAQSDE